jgi:uncharacterized LabA/DUF88 family protein
MSKFFFPPTIGNALKIMVFVDGENLAIRFRNIFNSKRRTLPKHIYFEKDIYVWSKGLNDICASKNVIRKYYYTSLSGDDNKIKEIKRKLKEEVGIEAPRVFKKIKNRDSKQVDISLATDMLTHAFRKNYEIAILIAGDGDYVPLVEAVQMEGCRVFLWFFEEGLNPSLKLKADWYKDIGEILLSPALKASWK